MSEGYANVLPMNTTSKAMTYSDLSAAAAEYAKAHYAALRSLGYKHSSALALAIETAKEMVDEATL